MPAKSRSSRPAYQRPYVLRRDQTLYLKPVEGKGRGVFSTRAVKKGERLEVTPALVLHDKETAQVQRTILRDYIFTLGNISKRLRQRVGIKRLDDASCVIMGIASFCNHDEHPNAEIVWEEHNGSLYHILVATRAIPKGAEICTTYGEGWFDGRKHKSN